MTPDSSHTGGGTLSPGVHALDHTADLGIEIEAGSLPELMDRAAHGMMALVRDTGGAEPAETRDLALEAPDTAGLLARWLRELLFLHEAYGLVYLGADLDEVTGATLRGRVRLGTTTAPAQTELKGVTYHDLSAGQSPDGRWRARVIFDV